MKDNQNKDKEIDEIIHSKISEKNYKSDKAKADNGGLSHYEVECILPDYLFNRLSNVEREIFEISILNYPDLERELKEGAEIFEKVEQLDYKKVLDDKSQYLPDRVMERLEQHNALYSKKPINIKRLVLAGVFAASLLIYMYFTNDNTQLAENKIVNTKPEVATVEKELFTELEKEYIIENIEDSVIIENMKHNDYYDAVYSSNLNENISGMIDNYYYDVYGNLVTDAMIQSSILDNNSDYNYSVLIENLANIDEKTFQELLKSIEEL